MSKKFSRNCPECGVEIIYQNKFLLDKANASGSRCKKCRNHKILSPETISLILELNNKGELNREIGRKLNISHTTVAYHIRRNGGQNNWSNQKMDIVSDTEVRCQDCKEIKPIGEFWYKTQNYEWKFSSCRKCRELKHYMNLNSSIDKFLLNKFQSLKNRSKRSKIEFDLSTEYFMDQFHKQNGLCFYTDEEMICKVGEGKNRNSFSIDKIIPEKGYVKGNVVFCINRINMAKNDLLLDEIQKWMPDWFYRIKIKELVDHIRATTDVNLVLSFADIGIDDLVKYRGGGFNGLTNPPTIMVPTYKYICNRIFKRLNAEEILFILAHEFGHYISYTDGYWTNELVDLRTTDKKEFLDEENRAWDNSLKILVKLITHSFPSEQFFSFRNHSIKSYIEE